MAKHTPTAELLSLVDFVYDHEYCDGVAKTYRPILLEDDHRYLAKQAFRDELHEVERRQIEAWLAQPKVRFIHSVDEQITAFIHFVDDLVTERRGYLVEPLDLSNPYEA